MSDKSAALKEVTMDERIANLIKTKEQLEASLFKVIGALEFAQSLNRIDEEKKNDKSKK